MPFSFGFKKCHFRPLPHKWNMCYLNHVFFSRFRIFILFFVENSLEYNTVNDFSLWLRTGYNPAEIICIQSHSLIQLTSKID